MQAEARITTGLPFRHWIGQVLGTIAAEQQQTHPDEPFLTALVVRADGTIGDGYAIPVKDREGHAPDDLEMHAAEERLRCYEYFGADLPPDGGRPSLTEEVRTRRENARRIAPPPRRAVCPRCFLQFPATGVCNSCDT